MGIRQVCFRNRSEPIFKIGQARIDVPCVERVDEGLCHLTGGVGIGFEERVEAAKALPQN